MSSAATGSLEVLTESYGLRLEELSQCCKLYGKENSTSVRQVLEDVVEEVAAIEELLSAYGKLVEEEATKLEEAKSLCLTAKDISARLTHMSTNWPARMATHRSDSKPSSTSSSPPRSSAESSAQQGSTMLAQSQRSSTTHNSSSTSRSASLPPRMAYLTLDEFNQVPKYIRGRLAYDQANMAIDELHKAYTAKYTLLHTPRSQLNDASMKRCKGYKLQNTDDTKGTFFITDHDIKTDCSLKLDPPGRTALQILRHCGRLREVHGGGFVRFVLRT